MNLKKIKLLSLLLVATAAIVIFFDTESAQAAKIYQVLAGTGGDSTGTTVRNIWESTIALVNYAVIAVLIFIAFANILRLNISTYGIKKFLPTLVLAIIAANFSYLICRLLIDLANMAISALLMGPNGAGIKGLNAGQQPGEVGIAAIFKKTSDGGIMVQGNQLSVSGFVNFTLATIMEFVGSIFVLILAFLFLIRNYIIYFLVALSPLAFLATVLPQTKSMFNMWWSNFWKWAFMPIVSLFWLWLGGLFVNDAQVSDSLNLVPLIFASAAFYMAITSPFKLGGGIMKAWQGAGKKVWGATGGVATGFAKKRIGEEVADRKQRIVNWAANKKVLPTRRGFMTARETEAFRRQRFAGPSLVGTKQAEDADAGALKTLLDDHFSGKKKLPTAIISRYNAQLRKRGFDESTSIENAGVGTLLDSKLATTDNGMLAMPTFEAGINKFKSEEDLKRHTARLAIIKKTLGKAKNNRDRERLIAALAKDTGGGTSKLGQLLGQKSIGTDKDDEKFEAGLDAIRALDIGPYSNIPGKKDSGAALSKDASAYWLRGLGGGGSPSSAVGEVVEQSEATKQMTGVLNNDQVSNHLANLASQTGVDFTEAMKRASLDESSLSPEALASTQNLFGQIRQSRDEMIVEEMKTTEKRVDEEMTSTKRAFDAYKKGGNAGFTQYKAGIRNGSNALEAGNTDVALNHAKAAGFTHLGGDKESLKPALEKFLHGGSVGVNQIEADRKIKLIDTSSDWGSYDKHLREQKTKTVRAGAEASVTSQLAMRSVADSVPANLTVSNLSDPKALQALDNIAKRIVEGNQELSGAMGHLNNAQQTEVKSKIGEEIQGALKDGLSKVKVKVQDSTDVNAQAMALKSALRDPRTTKTLSRQIAQGMEKIIKNIPKPTTTLVPPTTTTLNPPNPIKPGGDLGESK